MAKFGINLINYPSSSPMPPRTHLPIPQTHAPLHRSHCSFSTSPFPHPSSPPPLRSITSPFLHPSSPPPPNDDDDGKMSKNIFKPCHHIEFNTLNPNPILKITISFTKTPKSQNTFDFLKFFGNFKKSQIFKNSNFYFVLCIRSIIHILLFFIFYIFIFLYIYIFI